MNSFIYYLVLTIQGFTVAAVWQLMLTPRFKRIPTIIGLIYMTWTCPMMRFILLNYQEYTAITRIICGLGTFVYIAIMFKDPVWKRLTAVLMVSVATVASDGLMLTLVKVFFTENMEEILMSINPISIMTLIIAEAVMIMSYMGIVLLWYLIKDKQLIKGYLPTIFMPISQVCFGFGVNTSLSGALDSYSIMFYLGELLGFAADIYWMYELVYRSKRASDEQRLKEMEHAMQLEQVHYQEIEKNREQLSRLRHDMNNQILAVRHLMESGHEANAGEMLDKLSKTVKATAEYPFCGVPIINAVLNEKTRECEAKGIELEVDMKIANEIAIEDVSLCSIFSNLLDNAIRAVSEVKDAEANDGADAKSWVRLSAITKGGILVIKTVNPSLTDGRGKKRKGHGKGSLILQEIAGKYNGKYETSFRNGEFTAIINLMVS